MGSSSQVLKELDRRVIKELVSLLSPDDPALLMRGQLTTTAAAKAERLLHARHSSKCLTYAAFEASQQHYGEGTLTFSMLEAQRVSLCLTSHISGEAVRLCSLSCHAPGCAASPVASPRTHSLNSCWANPSEQDACTTARGPGRNPAPGLVRVGLRSVSVPPAGPA